MALVQAFRYISKPIACRRYPGERFGGFRSRHAGNIYQARFGNADFFVDGKGLVRAGKGPPGDGPVRLGQADLPLQMKLDRKALCSSDQDRSSKTFLLDFC